MANWDRHKPDCIPVMVKEYGEKGRGLVAARDIKMGEQILIDKAMVNGTKGYRLNRDAERLLINQKILKDISLLNHSCSPNAAIGLLDDEESKEQESRIELRAIKDIAKEVEITIFYPIGKMDLPWLHADIREMIHEEYGFDCKCPVCSGVVPNQDDIITKMEDVIVSSGLTRNDEDEKTFTDWTRQAIGSGVLAELVKPLNMVRPDLKIASLLSFWKVAIKARNPALKEKAVHAVGELAEKTGLEAYKRIFKKISEKNN